MRKDAKFCLSSDFIATANHNQIPHPVKSGLDRGEGYADYFNWRKSLKLAVSKSSLFITNSLNLPPVASLS